MNPIDALHSNTDRQLGHTEERLRQALDALRECREALSGALVSGINGAAFVRQAEQAKLMAELVLSLEAKRKPEVTDFGEDGARHCDDALQDEEAMNPISIRRTYDAKDGA